jgi:hypothetical protein
MILVITHAVSHIEFLTFYEVSVSLFFSLRNLLVNVRLTGCYFIIFLSFTSILVAINAIFNVHDVNAMQFYACGETSLFLILCTVI